MKKINARILVAILTLVIVLAGCGKKEVETKSDSLISESESNETETVTIRLGVGTSRTPHFTALVGNAKDIFKKHGLNVETVEFTSGIETINGIELGQVDFGYVADFGGLNRLGNAQGANLKFLSRLESSATMRFYVNPEKISSLEDLKGKKIVCLPGTVIEYWDAKVLDNGGLTKKDAEFLNVNSTQEELALLQKGEADACWIAPANFDKVESYGHKPLTTQEEQKLYQDSFYVATPDYMQEHEDVLVKFFQSIDEINKFIEESPDQAADIISSETGMEKETVKSTLSGCKLVMDFSQSAYDNLQGINEWALQNDYYEKEIKLDDYIDTGVLKKALPDAEVYK
ncbi:MAG: ABC transporter substrate-binding protein [Lachnospiraceae bacterium]